MTASTDLLNRYVIPDMPRAAELAPYLRRIDANRWYSNFGPLVTAFEARMGQYLRTHEDSSLPALEPVALASCYHALQIGLQLFRLPKDARVLIPAITFPACPLAVRHAGAEPVLGDIDAATWQLTPAIARRIAAKTPIHAVMPVALYGVPVDAAAWDDFMRDTGIPVIIDAAAAFEAQKIPQHALVAHSLHATKPFSIGEGGVLISRNADLGEETRSIANFGTRMRVALQDGCNAKMSEYHAAVALAQFDRWHTIKSRKQKIFAAYKTALRQSKLDVTLQPGIDAAVVGTLMLRSPQKNAVALVTRLNSQGIYAHRMYLPPLYHHPHFANLAVAAADGTLGTPDLAIPRKYELMVNSEILHETVFGLPCHSFLTAAHVKTIIRALAEAA
jgi:dTDP-4-amino-4,6-dideoxygalactose transaminase